jgi:transposase
VRQYVDSLDEALKLFDLPPYSPHLNPDEQVWAHLKRQVSKQFVQDKDGMKKLAPGALHLCGAARLGDYSHPTGQQDGLCVS